MYSASWWILSEAIVWNLRLFDRQRSVLLSELGSINCTRIGCSRFQASQFSKTRQESDPSRSGPTNWHTENCSSLHTLWSRTFSTNMHAMRCEPDAVEIIGSYFWQKPPKLSYLECPLSCGGRSARVHESVYTRNTTLVFRKIVLLSAKHKNKEGLDPQNFLSLFAHICVWSCMMGKFSSGKDSLILLRFVLEVVTLLYMGGDKAKSCSQSRYVKTHWWIRCCVPVVSNSWLYSCTPTDLAFPAATFSSVRLHLHWNKILKPFLSQEKDGFSWAFAKYSMQSPQWKAQRIILVAVFRFYLASAPRRCKLCFLLWTAP